MSSRSFRTPFCLLAAVCLVAPAAVAGVNSPITVGDGQVRSSGAKTVNGSIRIGAGATVEGVCSTVNGSVRIGDGARVEGVRTVNGTIRVGEDVVIEDGATTVNGRIEIERGSRVAGRVETVNGAVELSGVELSGMVRTTNGTVVIADGTTVDGDVVIAGRHKKSWFSWGRGERRPLEVELSGGSVVTGDVIVEDPEREVVVLLRHGSEVRGRIEGAELVRKD